MRPIVVGLDLSLTASGIAHPAGVEVVRSSGRADATLAGRHTRLADLRARIVDVVCEHVRRPGQDLIVIEGPAFRAADPGVWDRAALWWLVIDRLRVLGYDVVVVPPATLKKLATGRGNADKGAMADAAARRIPHIETGGENNAVDALWLRAAGMQHYGQPLAQLPAAQVAALDVVAWPDAP